MHITPHERLVQACICRVHDVTPERARHSVEERMRIRNVGGNDRRFVFERPGSLLERQVPQFRDFAFRPFGFAEVGRHDARDEILDARAQGELRGVIGCQHLRRRVDPHELVRRQMQPPACAAVVRELAAEHEHEVGAFERSVNPRGNAEGKVGDDRVRIVVRHDTAAAAGRKHRNAPAVREGAERLRRTLSTLPHPQQRAVVPDAADPAIPA